MGVTPQGLTIKTIEIIKTEIEDDQLSTISPALNLQSNQPIGQLNASYAKKCAELWELGQFAYNAFNREAAEGMQLDNIGTITGTPRNGPKKSLTTCTLVLGASFSQPAGALMAHVVGNPDLKFVNRDPVVSTIAGTYTGIVFQSLNFGAISANAGTLTQITAPVTGWTSITNPTDAVLGNLREEDDPYRARQDDELTAAGSSTTDAIRADLLKVTGVQQAFCFENVTMYADVDGVPAKAIECVVFDGPGVDAANNDIAQAIWNSKPSGSETYGTTSGIAIDALGVQQTVRFSRTTLQNIYLSFDLAVNASTFPNNGVELVKSAVVARGNSLLLGDDVVALVIKAAALTVPGVRDVIVLRLGFAATPTNTANLAISGRQIARFDTSRVAVTIP